MLRKKQRRLQGQNPTAARAATAVSDYQCDPSFARRKRGTAATLLVGGADRDALLAATEAAAAEHYGGAQARARLAYAKGAFSKRGSSPATAPRFEGRAFSLRP